MTKLAASSIRFNSLMLNPFMPAAAKNLIIIMILLSKYKFSKYLLFVTLVSDRITYLNTITLQIQQYCKNIWRDDFKHNRNNNF